MEITLGHYLTVAACLFTLGMFGIFLNRKNVNHHSDVGRADAAGREHQSRRRSRISTAISWGRCSPCSC